MNRNIEFNLLQNNTHPIWQGDAAATGSWSHTIIAGQENNIYQLSIHQNSSIFNPPIARHIHGKQYEITDHLGNVRTVVGAALEAGTGGTINPRVLATNTYYPFGMLIGSLSENSEGYRFGFNGKEKDDQGEWGMTHYDYGFRIYNPALARFLSVDPLTKSYPWYTPYQFAGNKPIWAIDLDGLEELKYTFAFRISASRQMFIIENSSTLNQKMIEISKPEKASSQKVYFALKTYGDANAFVTNLGDGAILLDRFSKLSRRERSRVPQSTLDIIQNTRELFSETGIDPEFVLNDTRNGKEVWLIAVDQKHLEEGGLARSTHSIIHEIEAHLINRLNGTPSQNDKGFEEHMTYFNLYENLNLFNKYLNGIIEGYSIPYNEIPSNSPAGKNKEEVEKTIKKYSKEGIKMINNAADL